jgi:hypothetical protein
VLAALIFVLISITLIALGRGTYGGDIAAMQPRYRMYSSLLVLLTAFQWLELKPGRITLALVLLLGLLIQVSGIGIRAAAQKNHEMLTSSYYHWLIDGGFGRTLMPIYPPNQDRRLFIAWRTGRYNPIEAVPAKHRPANLVTLTTSADCDHTMPAATGTTITAYSKKPKAIAVELTLTTPGTIANTSREAAVVLCGAAQDYEIHLDARNFDDTKRQWQSLVILKSELPPGSYKTLFRQGDSLSYLGDISFK